MFPTPLIERLTLTFAGGGRAVLAGLAEIDREIGRANARGLDHGVAHARLGWWRAELERTAARAPAHPLTKRLAQGAAAPVDWRPLLARVTAAELALAGRMPQNAPELETRCQATHGAPWAVAAALLAPGAAEFGAALGSAIGLATALAAEAESPGISRAELAALARTHLARAERALPTAARAALAGALVARALVEELVQCAPRTPRAFVQPWIAWRAAREAQKE